MLTRDKLTHPSNDPVVGQAVRCAAIPAARALGVADLTGRVEGIKARWWGERRDVTVAVRYLDGRLLHLPRKFVEAA